MWSKKYIKKISKTNKDTFFTRSDWIFYFLSLKNMNVTFECHQLSRIRKFVMRKSIINPNSKIIFLNTNLLLDSKIDQTKYKEKLIVLHNLSQMSNIHKLFHTDHQYNFHCNHSHHLSIHLFDITIYLHS